MELRLIAAYAGPGPLQTALDEERDVFAEAAKRFDIDRPMAKAVVYAVMYGASGKRIKQMLDLESEEAGIVIRDEIDATYPEVKRLRFRLWRLCNAGGFYNLLGRRHELERQWFYKRLNYLIQGSGADIFKAATIRMHEAGVPLIALVHDEAVAEVPEAEVETVAAAMKELMEKPIAGRGPGGERPFTVEGLPVKIGVYKHWSEAGHPGFAP